MERQSAISRTVSCLRRSLKRLLMRTYV